MIKTKLNTPTNIADAGKVDFLQHIDLQCPNCKQNVKIPIPGEFVDYRSAYEEIKKQYAELAKFNFEQSVTIKKQKKLLSEIKGAIELQRAL